VLCFNRINCSAFSEQSATAALHRGRIICSLLYIIISQLDILFVWNYGHECSKELRERCTISHLKTSECDSARCDSPSVSTITQKKFLQHKMHILCNSSKMCLCLDAYFPSDLRNYDV